MQLCEANVELFDFEQVVNDLFLGNHSTLLSKASAHSDRSATETPIKCAIELNQIKNGLLERELWAMKGIFTKENMFFSQ